MCQKSKNYNDYSLFSRVLSKMSRIVALSDKGPDWSEASESNETTQTFNEVYVKEEEREIDLEAAKDVNYHVSETKLLISRFVKTEEESSATSVVDKDENLDQMEYVPSIKRECESNETASFDETEDQFVEIPRIKEEEIEDALVQEELDIKDENEGEWENEDEASSSSTNETYCQHRRRRLFACDRCNYTTVQLGHLKQHQMIHTGRKPLACDQCNFKTRYISCLKRHQMHHTGEKPYACDQCDYKYSSKDSLKRHIMKHSEPEKKLFACDQCNYETRFINCLKQHQMTHTGEKPFACDQCGIKYSSNNSLRRHLTKHSEPEKKLLACDQCDYKTIHSERLKKHQKKHSESKRIMGKVNQRKWSPSKMTRAIDAVRTKKMGWKKASKQFNVPKTTLMRLSNMKYGTSEEAAKIKRGRPTVLGKDLEAELVHYCLAMEASFFGLTRRDLRRMAVQLADRNNIEHPFKDEIAGKKWVSLFLKRHKTKLSERKPSGTSYNRALGFSKQNTEKFYNLLEEVYEKGKFTPDRIYNVDESGITVVQSKVAKIIGLKGKKQIAALTSGERGALITIVACMNASGGFVPPLVIFPRKNMSEQLKKGAPPGTIFAAHPSGWIQTNLFTQWFRHFLEFVNPTLEKPVLLLLDGHFSHTQNIDLIDLAKKNHVTIVSLPPHSSHKLQPLDKTFMGSLKVYYNEEIRLWLRHNERAICAFDVMDLFGKAYVRCQTAQIAINGFRVTGIYPLKKDLFSDAEYIEEANQKRDEYFYESVKTTAGNLIIPANREECDVDQPQVNVQFDPNQPSTSSAGQSCMFCNTKFSKDSKGELWVMCIMCSLWAHVDCSGAEKDVYICVYCR